MFSSAMCRQFSRGSLVRIQSISKLSPNLGHQLHFSTTSVRTFYGNIIPESTHQKLRKEYNLSDDFFVMYKEPKQDVKFMKSLKISELVVYASPLIGVVNTLAQNNTLEDFVGQDNFYLGCAIVFVYVLGVRFVANGFVKIIFYNRAEDFYRAYVMNKYKTSYKYVDFKVKDLKVINLHPDIPMARNFFKTGKQNFILHDDLFASSSEQDKLIGEAIQKWHAHWGK